MVRKLYESDIQSAIIQYLRLKRFVVFKHHSTGFTADKNGGVRTFRYGDKGISDIIACAPWGQFWAIEVKRKYGKPTPEQSDFLARIQTNGGQGILAYSLDDVMGEVEKAILYHRDEDKKPPVQTLKASQPKVKTGSRASDRV